MPERCVPESVSGATLTPVSHADLATAGNKCKYSHDLNQERKQQKASIYADQRDESKEDTMDKWNDEKLQQVVSKKGNPLATTDIVCKHFIDAVEGGTYGWFWECPNGGDSCKYRHALPPGFKLKSQKKKEEEDAKRQEISLEEFLEVERHKLDQSKLTPLTLETFAEWKKNRVSQKEAAAEAVHKAKTAQFSAGKHVGLSGRNMFELDSTLLDDDSDDGQEDDFDLQLLRIRTEKDNRAAQIERMRQLDSHYGGLNLGHDEDDGGAGEADKAGQGQDGDQPPETQDPATQE